MPDDYSTAPAGDTAPESSPDPLGILGWTIGGKYKIQSYLGGGGFGEVYEGYNANLTGQRLVIKFFKRVQAREKFDKEAKILCMLDHPNICRVIDYLPDEGAVVVCFIDGKDTGVMLKDTGALTEQQFLNVARSITSAIAYAHEKKIAHRDIKPGNIIIDKNNNVFLIDFGIAKEMGTEATKTAYTALTPMFAAPERQAGEKGYNPFISDVYETGVTLFNLATNSLPYRNPTNPDTSEWGGVAARRLSPELTRILKKATHPEPAKRYNSAQEMAEDIKDLKAAFGKPRRRSRMALWVILLMVLIVAGYLERDYVVDFWSKLFEAKMAEIKSGDSEAEQTPDDAAEQDGPGQPLSGTQDSSAIDADITEVPDEQPIEPEGGAVSTEELTTEEAVTSEPEVTKQEPPPPPPPPPPPAKANVALTVAPEKDVSLTFDGTGRQPGTRFRIDPGRYEVVVIQPDFPIFRRYYDVNDGPVDLDISLPDEFRTIDTLEFQVALIPPMEYHILEITRNGRKQTIHDFPYLNFQQPVGEWGFRLSVRGIGPAQHSKGQVDSCVIFPFNPQLREVITGNFGILKVGVPTGGDGSVARLLVYWTQI
jgi:serine/threonine protein kinase